MTLNLPYFLFLILTYQRLHFMEVNPKIFLSIYFEIRTKDNFASNNVLNMASKDAAKLFYEQEKY